MYQVIAVLSESVFVVDPSNVRSKTYADYDDARAVAELWKATWGSDCLSLKIVRR